MERPDPQRDRLDPDAAAETHIDGAMARAIRYSPSSRAGGSRYVVLNKKLVAHLPLGDVATTDAANRAALDSSVIHSLWFIAYAMIPF